MTALDYSPLLSSVSRHEVTEFRRATSGRITPGIARHSRVVLIVTMVIGLCALSVSMSVYSRLFGGGSTTFVLITTMLVAAGVILAYRFSGRHAVWARLVKLNRFASANNLSFTANGLVPNYPGSIFTVGRERLVPERLTRTTSSYVDLGNLFYTTGTGRSRRTHSWGYLAIKLDRMLPHMVLDAKSNNFLGTNLPAKFSRQQVLSLEGDFDRYFTLYCPREYERDALYVFTPDLMAKLIDEAAQFDVEIVDDWMFLYSTKPFTLTHADTLARAFRIIDTVGHTTINRTVRYADERTDDASLLPPSAAILGSRMENNSVASRGRRLNRRVSLAGIVVALSFVFLWLLNLLPMFFRA